MRGLGLVLLLAAGVGGCVAALGQAARDSTNTSTSASTGASTSDAGVNDATGNIGEAIRDPDVSSRATSSSSVRAARFFCVGGGLRLVLRVLVLRWR